MTQVIDLTGNTDELISVNHVIKTKKENTMLIKFARIHWVIIENRYYDEARRLFSEEDVKTVEIYRCINNIPRYSIYINDRKIGVALPRNTDTDDPRPYLLIPKSNNYTKVTGKLQVSRRQISRPYYIFDVDYDYCIKHGAKLMFGQNTNWRVWE